MEKVGFYFSSTFWEERGCKNLKYPALITNSSLSFTAHVLVYFLSKGFYDEALVLLNKAIKGEKKEKGLYINRGGE